VLIAWTDRHFGEKRPWFIYASRVNGKYCGGRVAVLYFASSSFACRKCCGPAPRASRAARSFVHLRKSQRIRLRLGGSPDPFAPFPLLLPFPRSPAACINSAIGVFAHRRKLPKRSNSHGVNQLQTVA
jgi:hypothetical protein